ncbi:MAG: DUF3419 family protein [Sandaracinaceae bacterium]|nr:DUF3419 family protein [Sandaracinaceae bacterium]
MTELAFAQVREDPWLDASVARDVARRLGRPARVLIVASGGCTALGLLALEEVERVVAIDASAAQLHWVELRREAMARLPIEAQLVLLGAVEATPQARRAAYEALRPHLSPPVRARYDAAAPEIEAGLLQAGRFEALFRELAAALAGAGLRPLEQPREAIASPRFREVFERVFERGALAERFGPAAVDYSMDRDFGEHFADVFARALARWPAGENYFLHQALEGRYLDRPDGLPPALTREAQAAARARGLDRLELVHARFDEALDALGGPFDLVQTSNISDWMPVDALERLLERVRARLAPGGAVLARRLNGDHRLADVVGRVLEVDAAASAALLASDRSFFYREVVVAYAPGGRR